MVKVRPLDQKRLLALAGHHAIVTDRKADQGGGDTGCTSGELLLAAIGSCATGSLRNFLQASGLPTDSLEVEVDYDPTTNDGKRDGLAITVSLAADLLKEKGDDIVTAAQSGRVVSRIVLGSRVTVRCRPV